LKRRRHTRFTLTQPRCSAFKTSRDVAIAGIDPGALVIKSVEPVRRDETVTVGFFGGGLEGRAAARTPAIEEGLVCHRVRREAPTSTANRTIVPLLWRAILRDGLAAESHAELSFAAR
jgi:hypothetical protein